MIFSNSFIKIFITDGRGLHNSEHLLSLLRFLFISRLLFIYISVFEFLCFPFIFVLKWESLGTFGCAEAESFSRFAITTMLFSLWHACFSKDILSLISTTLLLLCSLPCLLCPMSCWPKHPRSHHSHLSLSFLFLQSSPMALCIRNRLSFPNTTS